MMSWCSYKMVNHPYSNRLRDRCTVRSIGMSYYVFTRESNVPLFPQTIHYLTFVIILLPLSRVVIVVSLIWLSVGQIARMILYYGINRFDYSGYGEILMINPLRPVIILCSKHILKFLIWKIRFIKKSFFGFFSLYSCNLGVWFKGDIVRRT